MLQWNHQPQKDEEMKAMISESTSQGNLLGQLPTGIQEQVKDILARILKLAGYNVNSNTDSNSVGGTTAPGYRFNGFITTLLNIALLLYPIPSKSTSHSIPRD